MNRKLNRQIGIHGCHGNGYAQGFSYQKDKRIVFHYTVCLSLAKKENVSEIAPEAALLNDPNRLTPGTNTTNQVVLLECDSSSGEKWDYDEIVSEQTFN